MSGKRLRRKSTDENTLKVMEISCSDGLLEVRARVLNNKLQSKLGKSSRSYTNDTDVLSTITMFEEMVKSLNKTIKSTKDKYESRDYSKSDEYDYQNNGQISGCDMIVESGCGDEDEDTIDAPCHTYDQVYHELNNSDKADNKSKVDLGNGGIKEESATDIIQIAMAEFTKPLIEDNQDDENFTVSKKFRRISIPARLKGKQEDGVSDGDPASYQIQCGYCSKMFVEQFFLVSHVRLEHREAPKNSRPFKCSRCGQCFRMMHYLGQHLMTHRSDMERPYKCANHCNNTFNTRRQLDQHIMKYRNLRPYQCTMCPKAFPTVAGLRDHITVHRDDKPFLCYDCGASFKRNSQLKYHRLHHSVPKYHCDQCGRQFVTAASFSKHMATHDPNRVRYPCTHCGMTLTRKSHLAKHIEKIHISLTEQSNPSNDFRNTSSLITNDEEPMQYTKLTPSTI